MDKRVPYRRPCRCCPRTPAELRRNYRHCEKSEAIQGGGVRSGLLRFARNDELRATECFQRDFSLRRARFGAMPIPADAPILTNAAMREAEAACAVQGTPLPRLMELEIGRASCRERVCQYV